MPKITVVSESPPANAFEREFGPEIPPNKPKNRLYCGDKQNLPQGYTGRARPSQCLKKGIWIGKQIEKEECDKKISQLKTEHEKEKKKQKTKTTIESNLKVKQLIEKIKTQGLPALKRHLHLDTLNQRELNAIAIREHGRQPFVPHYSRYTKEELIQALLARGYKH